MGGKFNEIHVSGFQDALNDMLREYGDAVYVATEEGLDAAAYTLMAELKSESPKQTPSKRKFALRWKVKKYKMARYIGNSTVVTDKSGNKISLANILEYSTIRGKPFIKMTYNNSANKMAEAVFKKIKGL